MTNNYDDESSLISYAFKIYSALNSNVQAHLIVTDNLSADVRTQLALQINDNQSFVFFFLQKECPILNR